MNTLMQSRLDRLELCLNTLTESITTYMPSLPAAHELLVADAALTSGIDKLIVHQRNHERLQRLHATVAALEAQLRVALTDLAEARSAIQGTTGSRSDIPRPPAALHRGITPQELLAHAHNTAKFAAPLGFIAPGRRQSLTVKETVEGVDEAPAAVNGAGGTGLAPEAKASKNPALAALEPGLLAWLDPITQIPFTPWPSNEMMARSGLAHSQGWSGAIDPDGDLPGGSGTAPAPPEGMGDTAVEIDQEQRQRQHEKDALQAAEAKAQVLTSPSIEKPKLFMGMELLGSDEE